MAWYELFRRPVQPTEIKAASPENPSTSLNNPDAWLLDWAGASNAQLFGGPVNERVAMSVSAVYRCVSLIAGVIGGLPLGVYHDDPREGRVPSPEHRLSALFSNNPFPGHAMSAFNWKEIIVSNLLLYGNGFSVIRYDGAARIVGFEWCDPTTVSVTRTANQRNIYKVFWTDGRAPETVDHEDMLHFAGPGFDGIMGAPRIRYNARNAIALNRTLESAAGLAHDNAIKPSAIFKLPAGISPDAIKRISNHFINRFAGRNNVGKPLFVDAGTEVDPLAIPLTDLSTIAAMRFSIADISRFYGVPLALLNESGDGTTSWGSGIDSLIRGFLRFTLDTDLNRIESEINSKIFANSEYYALFDRDQLLAMDAVQLAQATSAEINSGQVTINEARRRRHRPVVEGGDIPLVNSTLVPLDQAIAPPPPPPAPPSPPDTTPPQDTANE